MPSCSMVPAASRIPAVSLTINGDPVDISDGKTAGSTSMALNLDAGAADSNSWRRSVTGDMTSAFNFADKPDYSIPKLPPTSNSTPLTTTDQCTVGAPPPYPVPSNITMPRQQAGRAKRPSGICHVKKKAKHHTKPAFTG